MLRHYINNKTARINATESIIRNIKASRVLEIGAGDYSFEYVFNGKNYNWYKVDFAQPADVICDINSEEMFLPFVSSSFDLVICTEVLEHLLWPHRLLAEIYRVLSISGFIIISVPNMTSLSYRVAWLLGHLPSCAASGNIPVELGSTSYKISENNYIGGHVIDFNIDRLTKLLLYSGFEILKIKGSGIIWYRQILPHWLVPPTFASNIICLGKKSDHHN